MISLRWGTLVSVLVFTLAMATAGSARAQWGFPGISGPSGPGFETVAAYGLSPVDDGSFRGAGSSGLGGIGTFPLPGSGRSIGRRPLTATSFQPLYNGITSLPGWNGRVRWVRRRH